jgi:RNA polymerase sigma-70 factor (ECF subfamily)
MSGRSRMPFGRRKSEAPPVDGDRFSGEALEFLDALYGTAVRLTRDADIAQDLVQDTYLKAFRARARFVPGTNLKAWLYTILHNTWRNRRRDRARARVEADSETLEVMAEQGAEGLLLPPDSPEARLVNATLSDDLRTALDDLPEAFRETVWLRDVEELSYQEIATVLAIPIGTVMSRLSRGRRQLYRALTAAGRNVRGAAAS